VGAIVGVGDGVGVAVGVGVAAGEGCGTSDENVTCGDGTICRPARLAVMPNCCKGLFCQEKMWNISLVAPSTVPRQAKTSQICTAVLVLAPRFWLVWFCVIEGRSLECSAIGFSSCCSW